jgi:hypothetical protein
MIDPETLAFLDSDAGTALLDHLAEADLSEAAILPLLTRLRKRYPAAIAGAALEQARLRRTAVSKFGAQAAHLFFTRDGLEQASDPLARAYRADRIGPGHLIDAACGLGADGLTYAASGPDRRVTGIDRDPLRVAIAQVNARRLGLDGRAVFLVGDVTVELPLGDAIFFDPARRDAAGRRLHHVEAYQPPLSTVRRWRTRPLIVKLSPGVALDQMAEYGGRLEFLSAGGDLKEALLWLEGDDTPLTRRAVLLRPDGPLSWDAPAVEPEPVISAPRGWLIEPDPALIRAGLVRPAGAAWGAAQLDETIAYLTADVPPVTPWARAWRIHDWLPFNLHRLRAALRARGVGRVTVKQRGWSGTPEALIRALKLSGGHEALVVVTRLRGDLIALIGDAQPLA